MFYGIQKATADNIVFIVTVSKYEPHSNLTTNYSCYYYHKCDFPLTTKLNKKQRDQFDRLDKLNLNNKNRSGFTYHYTTAIIVANPFEKTYLNSYVLSP